MAHLTEDIGTLRQSGFVRNLRAWGFSNMEHFDQTSPERSTMVSNKGPVYPKPNNNDRLSGLA